MEKVTLKMTQEQGMHPLHAWLLRSLVFGRLLPSLKFQIAGPLIGGLGILSRVVSMQGETRGSFRMGRSIEGDLGCIGSVHRFDRLGCRVIEGVLALSTSDALVSSCLA